LVGLRLNTIAVGFVGQGTFYETLVVYLEWLL
jgi:hypothetical protein